MIARGRLEGIGAADDAGGGLVARVLGPQFVQVSRKLDRAELALKVATGAAVVSALVVVVAMSLNRRG